MYFSTTVCEDFKKIRNDLGFIGKNYTKSRLRIYKKTRNFKKGVANGG